MHKKRSKKQNNTLGLKITLSIVLVIVVTAGTIVALNRMTLLKRESVSSTKQENKVVKKSIVSNKSNSAGISWTNIPEMAIASETKGVVKTNGQMTARPTASTAKTIAALAILQVKPIVDINDSSEITLGSYDVSRYEYYINNNGSNTKVALGENISEYQALEAIMLPSSNNMADSLAVWAFGSLDNYRSYATKMLKGWGLRDTTIGVDACGFDPSTTSTAHDLAMIGLKALEDPTLSSIINKSSATIPVAGAIYNTNKLLNGDDIIGVKTGETDQAGGVFILGAKVKKGNQFEYVTVAAMGANNAVEAQNGAKSTYDSIKNSIDKI